ncbi:YfzA family protein [Gracilibacillus sp. S3-1-1]|uniref:YfzA family protein n=1 Tax=Gracilibacillus pellucidus TaxID=3095368 RepID=A0ACC6M6P9_9BACI|nr:YfzA family protein [Gracilibacillus sp. S3-1-1]MDX8046517.1 YfzA family protein [Gracilibacillus sp. S3-1-1]
MKKWLLHIGFFLILNLLMLVVDGTALVNDFEFGNFGNEILQTEIFTEWFNTYDTPFFNVILLFGLIHIILFPFYSILFKKSSSNHYHTN